MIIAQFKYFVWTDFHRNETNEPFLFLCTNDSPGRFSQAGSACCITSQNNTKCHHNWSWSKIWSCGISFGTTRFQGVIKNFTDHRIHSGSLSNTCAGRPCCITSQNNTKYHHNWSWTKNSSWAGLDLVGKKTLLFFSINYCVAPQITKNDATNGEAVKIGIFDPGFYFEFVWEQLSPKFVKYWPKFHNHPGLKVWDDYQMYSIKLSEVLPSSQNSELDISAPLTNSAPNAQIIQKTTFAWIGWDK